MDDRKKRYIPFSQRPGAALDGLLEDLLKAWKYAHSQEERLSESQTEGEPAPPQDETDSRASA